MHPIEACTWGEVLSGRVAMAACRLAWAAAAWPAWTSGPSQGRAACRVLAVPLMHPSSPTRSGPAAELASLPTRPCQTAGLRWHGCVWGALLGLAPNGKSHQWA